VSKKGDSSNAKVNISILESLHDEFCLCSISKKEDECNILFNILFGADEDLLNQKTFQRRKTLSLLLYLLAQSKETPSKYWYLLNMLYFQRKQNNEPLTIPDSLFKISRAWMYYVRHEYFCMGLIAIFVGIQHAIIQGYKSPKQISDYCWYNYIDKNNSSDIPEYIKDVFEILKSGRRWGHLTKNTVRKFCEQNKMTDTL